MRSYLVLALGLVGLSLARGVAAEPWPRAVWLTGDALQARLDTVIPKVFWSGVPLRKVIRTLSATQQIAVLIDRRVDPDQPVDLTLGAVTVEGLLQQVAEDRGLGLTRIGAVTYLGPAETTATLRTLATLRHDDVAKLPPGAAAALRRSESLAWDDFAAPRELLGRLAESAGMRLQGIQQVPHDLWAAADLPALPLVDRLTLIAVQFNLTYRIAADGGSIGLEPVPERVAVVRRYPGGTDPEQLAQRWSELAPDSQVKVVGSDVYVRGLVEDHERLSSASRGSGRARPKRPSASRPSAPKRGEIRFTVQNAKGPLDRMLVELAQKLEVEVRIERGALEAAGISPSQTVSFSVKDATADELFEAVLRPAGCSFRREGKVIVVVPAGR